MSIAMKREEELKPCPFCGSNAHVEQYGDARQSTKYQCDNCGCMLETGEEWGFGRDWNCRALLSTPKPKPVGWETDAEWDLEMRCCNITEATPFAEVSKLINDLWQQYCLAAEPKPDAANARNAALEEAAKLIDQYMLCGVGADVLLPRGNSGNKVGFGYAAAIRALTAKQTDGRDGE